MEKGLNYCIPYVGSGAKSQTQSTRRREGDVKNWQALWKALKAVQNTTSKNLTTFERIIFANARQRGKYLSVYRCIKNIDLTAPF